MSDNGEDDELERMKAEVVDAMKKAGIPRQIIYAYQKTGLILSEAAWDNYSDEIKAEWLAAVDEYFELYGDESE